MRHQEPACTDVDEADTEHGVMRARLIADAHGEEAAQRWFHHHQQLPDYDARDCPMPLLSPPSDADVE